jgi:RHS repeat-associated protein
LSCARDAYSLSFFCVFESRNAAAAPYTCTWSPALAGTHALTARATDSAGGVTTSAAVNITVTSSSAPMLSFTSPTASASFTTPASVPLVATATPAAGTTITRIEVYSGATLIGATNSNTLNTNWLTLNPGAQTLTARAIDSNGGVATATVAITVTAAANETITFLHNDLAGSPMAATNLAGTAIWKEDYRPFGERQQNEAASSNQRQWFTGKPQDSETGFVYSGARYYDPVVGRFMGVDPAGLQNGNLHSFNRYAYANNNPYKFVDLDGRQPSLMWCFGGPFACAAGVGVAVVASAAIISGGSKSGDNSGMSGGGMDPCQGFGVGCNENKGGSETKKKSSEHHVCTDKNCVSDARGGPWTPKFQEMFDKAGMDMQNPLNRVVVEGHRGPHPEAYHKHVYHYLNGRTAGLAGEEYAQAFRAGLGELRTEIATPGSPLNKMVTGG